MVDVGLGGWRGTEHGDSIPVSSLVTAVLPAAAAAEGDELDMTSDVGGSTTG